MSEKRLNIRDIAKLSGVSASTVSRVLNGSEKISEKTRKQVFEVINKYGFKPNMVARNLAINKTYNIGIIIPQNDTTIYSSSFFHEALNGACSVFSQHGYNALISSGYPTELDAIKRLISTSCIDGILLLRSIVNDPIIKYLYDEKFPFVVIGTCIENPHIYSVDNDNVKAAYDLALHLYSTGKRRIAFIGSSDTSVFIVKRLEGYKKLLTEKGIDYNPEYIKLGLVTEDYGYEAMREMLDSKTPPDAVMVMDESICVGVMKTINEYGLRVPEQIAVACFNESAYTRYSKPSLTTVSLNFYQLGSFAAKTILSLLQGEKVEEGCRYVSHLITIRESTRS